MLCCCRVSASLLTDSFRVHCSSLTLDVVLLQGVNFQAEGLLQDLALIPHIKSLGLVLFVWGEDLNEQYVKQMLCKHEVDAIIFDR